MPPVAEQPQLYIGEFGGSARSGKGRILEDIAARHGYVETIESGAAYRVATLGLLTCGLLEPDMPEEDARQRVEAVGVEDLAALVADRERFVDEHGDDALHTQQVDRVVGKISPVAILRQVVKADFRKRVEAIRDAGEKRVLLVDGRNLAPVVQDIPGTCLVMRTFVHVGSVEAARRVCKRDKIPMNSKEGTDVLLNIMQRNARDSNRPTDAVIPDEDAIDYWNPHLPEDYQTENDDDWLVKGVGAFAVDSGRQILFNTTFFRRHPDPLGTMLKASGQMFDEAMATTGIMER